jgi:hypothetical protein
MKDIYALDFKDMGGKQVKPSTGPTIESLQARIRQMKEREDWLVGIVHGWMLKDTKIKQSLAQAEEALKVSAEAFQKSEADLTTLKDAMVDRLREAQNEASQIGFKNGYTRGLEEGRRSVLNGSPGEIITCPNCKKDAVLNLNLK